MYIAARAPARGSEAPGRVVKEELGDVGSSDRSRQTRERSEFFLLENQYDPGGDDLMGC